MGRTCKKENENEASTFFFFLKSSTLKLMNVRSSLTQFDNAGVFTKGSRNGLKCGPRDIPGRDGKGTD